MAPVLHYVEKVDDFMPELERKSKQRGGRNAPKSNVLRVWG